MDNSGISSVVTPLRPELFCHTTINNKRIWQTLNEYDIIGRWITGNNKYDREEGAKVYDTDKRDKGNVNDR